MNDLHLHDGLERVSHGAPQVDAARVARTATAMAGRSRRRGYALTVPTAAAVAVVAVIGAGAALPSGAAPTGRVAGPAAPAASAAVTAGPSGVPTPATAPVATPTAVASSAATPTAATASAAAVSPVGPTGGGQGLDAGRQSIAYGGVPGWTCCDDADRAEVVKPGGSFVGHFRGGGAGVTEPAITVTITLTGPFSDVKTMMADPPVPGGSRYTSAPLTLSGPAEGVQVATVPIPAAAEPGLYLVSIVDGGSGGSAGSVEITR